MKPPVVILCGGRGTRLQRDAASIPKPLVEIGGKPILWHVIQIYAAQGFTRFLLATGYKSELIQQFATSQQWPPGVFVECLFTGVDTSTGGRALKAARTLKPGRFCLTYADGVADIDLHEQLRYHELHRAIATMTVVQPELQFGVAELGGDDTVRGFVEKPRSEHWINGGFFVFEHAVVDYLQAESVLEREPLQSLAGAGELRAFKHRGFWDCMDTYKDAIMLNDLWDRGEAPWIPRS
jgi:glucose-1-phosphate cytidylyltransferase